LVEDDLEIVAAQQVDGVVGGILGQPVELAAQGVELVGDAGALGVAVNLLGAVEGDGAGAIVGTGSERVGREVLDPQLAPVVGGADQTLVVGVDLGDEAVDGFLGIGVGFGFSAVEPQMAGVGSADGYGARVRVAGGGVGRFE